MATQTLASTKTIQQPQFATLAGGVAVTAIAVIMLAAIDPSMPLFPLLSAIAFPALLLVPFLISNLRVPAFSKVLVTGLIIVILVPIFGVKNSAYLALIVQLGIYAVMGVGLNIVVGFAGLLDLGYVAFFAVGAYLWGVATSSANTFITVAHLHAAPDLFYLFVAIGVICAAIAGILLGLPVLRLRGDYLAIVTLGFGEMIRILIANLNNLSSDPTKYPLNITNGTQGLLGIAQPTLPQFLPDLVSTIAKTFGFSVSNPTVVAYQLFFYLMVILLGIFVVILAARLDNSPIGRAWTAIREDETAAIAMGVPLVRMKLLAFATGAAFAGAMGALYAAWTTFIDPASVQFDKSILILVIVIVGGMGSIRGVLLGATVVTLLNLQILKGISQTITNLGGIDWVVPIINWPIKNWPPQLDPTRYNNLVFGLLLVLMMIFRPAGILPARRRHMELQEAIKDESQEHLDRPDPTPFEEPSGPPPITE
jgi:branched-chain amino acid transport system permease protein